MPVQETHSGNFATTHSGQVEHQMKHSVKPTLLYLPEFSYFVHSLFLKSHNSSSYLPPSGILLVLGQLLALAVSVPFPLPNCLCTANQRQIGLITSKVAMLLEFSQLLEFERARNLSVN